MKKKILIRIGSLRHGGAEKVLTEFLKNVSPDKYEIDLLLNLYSGKYLPEIPDWINIIYINKGDIIITNKLSVLPEKIYRVLYQKTLTLFPFLLYRFILKGKQYDIEFAAIHGFDKEILNSPQKNSKKLIWIHADIFSPENFNWQTVRNFFNYDKIMVISNKIKVGFFEIAKTQEEKNKIVRIYNPLNIQEIIDYSNEYSIRDKLFENEYPVFIAVGTVYSAKAFDRLLKIHKELIAENYNHNLLIIGDGLDYEKTLDYLKSLDVEDTAKMIGYQSNPYPYFKIADFFILSSRHEGFPTVLTEALVLKKPIIATDVSGVRDLLEDGKYGLIVENSEIGIKNGIKQFLTDKKLVHHYSNQVKELNLPWTLENSVQAIEKIIDEL